MKKLQAVLLCALVLAVLARHEAAAGERAFVGVAAVALQEELAALATANAAFGFSIFGYLKNPLALITTASRAANYTRRRLGGRQPLWGMGVTSRMKATRKPTAAMARMAASRPEPGPFTYTPTVRMPLS